MSVCFFSYFVQRLRLMTHFSIKHHRYIDNICKNPAEEKFRKIKVSNKVFQVSRKQKNLNWHQYGTYSVHSVFYFSPSGEGECDRRDSGVLASPGFWERCAASGWARWAKLNNLMITPKRHIGVICAPFSPSLAKFGLFFWRSVGNDQGKKGEMAKCPKRLLLYWNKRICKIRQHIHTRKTKNTNSTWTILDLVTF